MEARNFNELPYSRFLQIPDGEGDFITLEELKPANRNISNLQPYHTNYYELTNIIENPSCSSNSYPTSLSNTQSNSSNFMDLHPVESSINDVKRKRKSSFNHTSDIDDDPGGDAKSTKTNDENKKQNHSEIEKRRRDKMNTYITELSAMIPMCHSMSRKLDKLTVLRMAVQHVKTIRGAVHSYTEGQYIKPSFLTDQDLKHLILQAADGFLFVVGCDRGRILFVSESVSKTLNFTQGDLLGQSLFDILHPKDVAKLKEQLTSSDLNPRERLIDAKTMLPVKREVPQGSSRLCPGARRSFFCRMKCKFSDVQEEADTTTGSHNRKKSHNSDKKYIVIQCTGYLKSWAPTKIGLEEAEVDGDSESFNLSCLVAIGRTVPHISTVAATIQSRSNIRPLQFISRHTLDGKFLYVDQRATLVLGYLPQELLGSSIYEYYHFDDINLLSECHKVALQNTETVNTRIYRFKTKDGGFVRLQSEWRSFKNPWTKEIEYLISKNNLVLSDFRAVESSVVQCDGIQDNLEFFNQTTHSDMQEIISTHVEASKIGRQIAEQVMDSTRKEYSSTESSPDPESSMPISSADSQISSNYHQDALRHNPVVINDYIQPPSTFNQVRNNVSLSSAVNNAGGTSEEGIMEMMEDAAIREPSNNDQPTDGNDEAAMAVIMSLLEADAGLGGPVDFSGLPWPLP